MANTIEFGTSLDTGELLGQLKALAAVVGAGLLFKEMIANATEAEDALNKLSISMKAAGGFTQDARDKFTDYTAQLQRTTGVSDDAINANASLLVSIGKLKGEGLQQATKAALDFSKVTGSLESSFMIVAKAAEGNTGALSRYGIKIDENIPKNERFAAAMRALNSQFGGMAESSLNTFSGAIQKLTVSFSDVLEETGKLFTQSPVLRAVIGYLANAFADLADKIKAFAGTGDAVGSVVKALLNLGQAITQYVLPPLEMMFNTGKALFIAMDTGIQAIIAGFGALAQVIAEKILSPLGLISDETLAKITNFSEQSNGKLVSLAENTAEAFSPDKIMNFDWSAATSNFVAGMQQVANGAKAPIDLLSGSIKKSGVEISDTLLKIQAVARSALVNGIASSFTALGKAMATGQDGFKAFSSAVIGALGALAIQMGTVLVGMGLGFAALGPIMPIWGLSGAAAVAAGIGLITLGGAITALAGGGGGDSAPAAGGGGGSGGGGSASSGSTGINSGDVSDVSQAQPTKPSTNVTVQVNGNILDRRQTGLELAEVIQDTFGTNGIVYATGQG